MRRVNKGVWYALMAYGLWGLFPIYFKALQQVSAFQIVGHRVVWSFFLVMGVLALRRELSGLKAAIRRRTVLIYLAAGVMLGINWLTYVWGVNAGLIVETSLGYFINPLVNVLLGVIFLREKLRPAQWVPVAVALCGVTYLAVSYGSLPWIALVLAFSFGMYGLIKKVSPLEALPGLAMETGALFVPALGFLLLQELRGVGAFGHVGLATETLLALTGVVTTVPLLFFAAGARSVPLSTMGLIQYITPSLQFVLGVFLYNEPFSQAHLVGFILVWLALLIFSVESYLNHRKGLPSPAALPAQKVPS